MKLFNRIFLIFVAATSIGCSSNQYFYKGEKLPREELATIWASNVYIKKINGVRSSEFSLVDLAFAMPGPNEIEIYYTTGVFMGRIYTLEKKFELNLEAGHAYYLDYDKNKSKEFRVFDLGKEFDLPESMYSTYDGNLLRQKVEEKAKRLL